MRIAIRVLVFVATAYLAVLAILFVFQSRFIYPAPQAPAALARGYEEVVLETADGLRLRAFYSPARDGLPTLVYFHGNGSNLSGAVNSNGMNVAAGIGALLVEYRGYGGNGGEPSEQGFYRDGEAAMAWLSAQGIARDDTVIIGNSIGSGVATEMAARHGSRALVLIAPFTSLPDVAGERLWWLPARPLVRDRFDNLAKLPDIDRPVLVQHGTADSLIPHDYGRRLAGAAPAGRFQSFDGKGHDLSFQQESKIARRDWILALGAGEGR